MTSAAQLAGQTVLVIGGTKGIGYETARLARSEGAEVIVTARDPERLHRVGFEIGASIAAFDAADLDRVDRFFDALPAPIDHVMVTGAGPHQAQREGAEFANSMQAHLLLAMEVARNAVGRVRAGGTLIFMSDRDGRHTATGPLSTAHAAAISALARHLALEIAPIRVNVIAPGFVDTPLSAMLLGDELDARRNQLRARLPIGRLVEATDIAALAVHLMVNTAITGETVDIDGGQRLVAELA
jgi:NAD(P)-dependent dehydrogenase (short-subunit alcohol dehydrogenase family)